VARFEKDGKVFEITSADGRYATELRKHLRDGWLRVADPRCEDPLGAEPIEPALEAALRADPDDIGAALVYADWLQQRGHPRGALIAVQHRLSLNPRDADLIEAERKIVEEAQESLVSRPLVAHLAILRGKVETALSKNLFEGGAIAFDHGFIRKARVLLKRRGGDEDLLWELLRHPSARALSELDVTIDQSRDVDLVATLITHGPRPPLRSLALRVESRHNGNDQRVGTVDFSGLDTAFPDLETLDLDVARVRFGDLELPLRRLVLRSTQSDLSRILPHRTWDQLAVIAIDTELGDSFAAPRFPVLRSLTANTERVLEACHAITRAPDAKHLETLVLGKELPQEAVTMLVEQRAHFPALTSLHVTARANELDRLRAAGYPVQTSPPKNGNR
jgi:uncharacterized protein (TIGR02996 family)